MTLKQCLSICVEGVLLLIMPCRAPEKVVPDTSAPLYPSDLDIRPVVLHKEESGSSPRPRGSGKLLTSLQGVGLALLRLEHVEAVMQGNLQLQIIDESGKTRVVSPRWPRWWPRQQE